MSMEVAKHSQLASDLLFMRATSCFSISKERRKQNTVRATDYAR